ncbi:GNAT family N-acetyltransferase [Candidatus Omnitrophota bacterium]
MPIKSSIVPDPWLADIIKRDVYRIIIDDNYEWGKGEAEIRVLQAKPVFLYAKLNADFKKGTRFLEGLNFKLVNTTVEFQLGLRNAQKKRPNNDNAVIRDAATGDREQVVSLSGRSFKYSRFHVDEYIGKEVADKVKAEWAGNYFSGNRGDAMIVAEAKGVITGFLIIMKNKKDLIIDLIAVDKKQRRKGIASGMIAFMQEKYKDLDRICVSTQISNVLSIDLYKKCGFKPSGTTNIFHYHNLGLNK